MTEVTNYPLAGWRVTADYQRTRESRMGKIVTIHNLGETVEFDAPFTLKPREWHNEHIISSRWDVQARYLDSLDYPAGHDLGYVPDVYVPCEVDRHGDVYVNGDAYMDGSGWEFYSGGYTHAVALEDDPVMHSSEHLGGKLARDMISEGGTFVVTAVKADIAEDLIGWVVLRKKYETRTRVFGQHLNVLTTPDAV